MQNSNSQKHGIFFVGKLKVIKYTIGFFLLFIHCLLSYLSFYLGIQNLLISNFEPLI